MNLSDFHNMHSFKCILKEILGYHWLKEYEPNKQEYIDNYVLTVQQMLKMFAFIQILLNYFLR